MLGIIATGHGNFATGMVSAVNLLAGGNPCVIPVDFEGTESEETLQRHLKPWTNWRTAVPYCF